jgi:hypothetical protein
VNTYREVMANRQVIVIKNKTKIMFSDSYYSAMSSKGKEKRN